MYDWLAEIYKLVEITDSGETYLQLNDVGASEKQIAEIKQKTGIDLPISYKQFLRRWDGGKLYSSTLLSSEQILEYAERCGFKSPNSDAGFHTSSDSYYKDKPAHHLVFRTFDFGSDVYCLDSAIETAKGEFIVCKYDAEFELSDHLKMRYPSYEAMLMFDIYRDVVSEMYYVMEDYEETATQEEYAELESMFSASEEKLKMTLLERGADLSGGIRPIWDKWR
ncbi:SMI1/KNR4 family protein [Desulfococcaceae bacterium HSG9]|nr:SMI1/KNR4 family protein [Desulfococcaceae bacterium HSG9]